MRRWLYVLVVLVVSASLLHASDAEAKKLPLFLPTCGVPVTQSFRLSADLTACVGDGIVIGANNLTIDLNGKRVEGDGTTGAGIQNNGNFSRITIRNGTVRFFLDGLHANSAANRNTVIDVTTALNVDDGVEFDGGTRHVLRGVIASSNGDEGIELDAVSRAGLVGNWGVNNGSSGLDLEVAQSNVGSNRASGNDIGIEIFGDRNKVIGSRADRNATHGILVDGSQNLLKANKTHGNLVNGILINLGDGNVLKENIATGNGYPMQASDGAGLGIDAINDTGVVGSKNRAGGNDNPLECSGVPCATGTSAKKQLPLFLPTCGVPVTQSFRLSADLTGCVGDGIVIGADNLTIDLNRKRVEGDATTGAGIQNNLNFSRITVRNGTVRFFLDGFHANATATRNSIVEVVFASNDNDGLKFEGGSRHVVRGVRSSANRNHGIEFDGAVSQSQLTGSWAVNNTNQGFDLDVDQSRLFGNRAYGNGSNGIRIAGSNNRIGPNRLDSNGSNGILIDGDQNLLKGVKAHGNADNGIRIGTGSGNDLREIIASGNGYPLQVADGAGLGIDAANDASVVGRRNKARGNDNPLECSGVACA
jgi:parallel beta-helix repeat protein